MCIGWNAEPLIYLPGADWVLAPRLAAHCVTETHWRSALFSNIDVDITELPATESINFVPLERRYAVARFVLATVWTTLIGVVASAVVWWLLPETWRYGLFALLLLPILPLLTYWSCRRCGYALRDHDIAVRRGIFWQGQIVQPFVRLQHIELTRGPVDKYLDLAGLRIFSAGTGTETFKIPGLNSSTAERIRQRLLDVQSTEG